jgi:hypothetical protein
VAKRGRKPLRRQREKAGGHRSSVRWRRSRSIRALKAQYNLLAYALKGAKQGSDGADVHAQSMGGSQRLEPLGFKETMLQMPNITTPPTKRK